MNEATRLPDDLVLLREDEKARRDALDTTRSFLVQAPAGSGKTELLIQRLLALLARVDEPERILALTFTRKAAGEMRERVVEALSAAGRQEPLDPSQPHLAVTRALALAVLGIFGGADEGIPADAVATFEQALAEAGVARRLITYPGAPHSFFDRKAEEYADASSAAWAEVLDFVRAGTAGA